RPAGERIHHRLLQRYSSDRSTKLAAARRTLILVPREVSAPSVGRDYQVGRSISALPPKAGITDLRSTCPLSCESGHPCAWPRWFYSVRSTSAAIGPSGAGGVHPLKTQCPN